MTDYRILTWSLITFRNESFTNKLSNVFICSIPIFLLIFLTLIDLCIILVGIVGNIITSIVIISNKSMHTTTNCYLLNLAISDLVLLIVGVPYDIYSNWNPYNYRLGGIGCFFHCWISETSNNVSILTITAFTLERYLAICHPFAAHVMARLSRAIKFIIAIWSVAILCAFVIAMQIKFIRVNDESMCLFDLTRSDLPYSLEITTVITFVIPVLIITFSYIFIGISLIKSSRMEKFQGKRTKCTIITDCKTRSIDSSTKRILKMSVVIVGAFFICWLPFYIGRLSTSVAYSMESTVFMFYFADILNLFSAAVNPIIYNVMSNKFRDATKELLLKHQITSWLICQQDSSTTTIEFNTFKIINTNF